jgi:hypothetical protein
MSLWRLLGCGEKGKEDGERALIIFADIFLEMRLTVGFLRDLYIYFQIISLLVHHARLGILQANDFVA